jgi:hypothetical protein
MGVVGWRQGGLAGPTVSYERNLKPALSVLKACSGCWSVGVVGMAECSDRRPQPERNESQNRLEPLGVSGDSPLPASHSQTFCLPKASAHIETRDGLGSIIKGGGEGLKGGDFKVLESCLKSASEQVARERRKGRVLWSCP